MRRVTRAALLTVSVLVGSAAGIGVFTFIYAEGASYLTDRPQACANCHVMHEQYDGWQRASHRDVATCNDCHAPHDFFGKYATKAINGWNHSLAFTMGGFPEPIRITERNLRVTEAACRHCHAQVVHAIDPLEPGGAGAMSCVRCHRNVGHEH
ncbi:MAG: cytochrome c nitrite reductase small subunit [Planctomycetia bacterium]|nr:MAG: cytochrome c nitrite reductase small subunit [Planctomycetia bacterium]